MAKHKWNGKARYSKDSSSVSCVKCGCVRQYVGGFPTYFIDDTVYDKSAPKCDERLVLKNQQNDKIKYK